MPERVTGSTPSPLRQAELQLQLVSQRNAVGLKRDLGFERPRPGYRVPVQGHQIEAVALVEAQRSSVVVGGDQPKASHPGTLGFDADPVEERGANSGPGLVRHNRDDLPVPTRLRPPGEVTGQLATPSCNGRG